MRKGETQPLLRGKHTLEASHREQRDESPLLMQQYVILMRHGERRDSLPGAPHEADPPLTERGKADVVNAAMRIKQMIGQSVAKKLMIISSPFVRTMETAAELQRHHIGVDRSATIDNSLCEVFGPLRIKATDVAPDVSRKEAIGHLPAWGESIQDATDRFSASFCRNANNFANEHLILVTHGDAISAVLSHFYSKRVVYNTEFLSFIVMRRVGAGSDHFVLHGSHGVEWIVDGEEEDVADTPTVLAHSVNGGAASSASARSLSMGHAREGSSSSLYATPKRTASDLDTSAWGREPVGGEAAGTPTGRPAATNGSRPHRTFILALHCLVVLSQIPVVRIWAHTRDAVVFLLDVALLELLSVKYGWRSVVDRLPFSYGSPRRRVLYRLARYPLARTAWKLVALLCLYIMSSFPVSWISGGTAKQSMGSFGTIFENAWNGVLMLLMLVLDVWRGYLQNDEEQDDPHRESI